MLPLYEAKMIHLFDHRWATYEGGQARLVTDAEKADPSFVVMPRYWVSKPEVDSRLAGRWKHPYLLGWRDITNMTNERTLVTSRLPLVAISNKLPLAMPSTGLECLQAIWSSFTVDYVLRQKIGGTSLNFFYLYQLPMPLPRDFTRTPPWASEPLAHWIQQRVLELLWTARDLQPKSGPGAGDAPFHSDGDRRRHLRAELDAAMLHLYGLDRTEAVHVLDTFPIVERHDQQLFGEYLTKRLILEAFDAMHRAIETASPSSRPSTRLRATVRATSRSPHDGRGRAHAAALRRQNGAPVRPSLRIVSRSRRHRP